MWIISLPYLGIVKIRWFSFLWSRKYHLFLFWKRVEHEHFFKRLAENWIFAAILQIFLTKWKQNEDVTCIYFLEISWKMKRNLFLVTFSKGIRGSMDYGGGWITLVFSKPKYCFECIDIYPLKVFYFVLWFVLYVWVFVSISTVFSVFVIEWWFDVFEKL